MTWQGGREFFRLAATSLCVSLEPGDRLAIVAPRLHDGFGFRLARVAKRVLLRRASRAWIREELARKGQRSILRRLLGRGFTYANASPSTFDVVGPLGGLPYLLGGAAWLGYIPDLQHRRLPEMFSAAERDARDGHYRSILSHANAVVVNADAVRADLAEFYPDLPCPVTVLPFAPVAEADWLVADADVLTRYRLSTPYFICSNQFWRHKNHGVIFDSMAIAAAAGDDVRFVFTNATQDYRHPGYFDDLMRQVARLGIGERVHILGLLPKIDQIQLMRNAVAVVQPSLFEGGPGGGSIYNAVALGVPTLVSDIPVNREIAHVITDYFDPRDPADLAQKLAAITARPRTVTVDRDLMAAGDRRLRDFGRALRAALAMAAEQSYPKRIT